MKEWNILKLEPTGRNVQNSAAALEAKSCNGIGKKKLSIKKMSNIEGLERPRWGKHFQGDMKHLFDEYLDMFLSTA